MNGYIIEFGTMFIIILVAISVGAFLGMFIFKKLSDIEKKNSIKDIIDKVNKAL